MGGKISLVGHILSARVPPAVILTLFHLWTDVGKLTTAFMIVINRNFRFVFPRYEVNEQENRMVIFLQATCRGKWRMVNWTVFMSVYFPSFHWQLKQFYWKQYHFTCSKVYNQFKCSYILAKPSGNCLICVGNLCSYLGPFHAVVKCFWKANHVPPSEQSLSTPSLRFRTRNIFCRRTNISWSSEHAVAGETAELS